MKCDVILYWRELGPLSLRRPVPAGVLHSQQQHSKIRLHTVPHRRRRSAAQLRQRKKEGEELKKKSLRWQDIVEDDSLVAEHGPEHGPSYQEGQGQRSRSAWPPASPQRSPSQSTFHMLLPGQVSAGDPPPLRTSWRMRLSRPRHCCS